MNYDCFDKAVDAGAGAAVAEEAAAAAAPAEALVVTKPISFGAASSTQSDYAACKVSGEMSS